MNFWHLKLFKFIFQVQWLFKRFKKRWYTWSAILNPKFFITKSDLWWSSIIRISLRKHQSVVISHSCFKTCSCYIKTIFLAGQSPLATKCLLRPQILQQFSRLWKISLQMSLVRQTFLSWHSTWPQIGTPYRWKYFQSGSLWKIHIIQFHLGNGNSSSFRSHKLGEVFDDIPDINHKRSGLETFEYLMGGENWLKYYNYTFALAVFCSRR